MGATKSGICPFEGLDHASPEQGQPTPEDLRLARGPPPATDIPVSYTHLDVYKRQVLVLENKEKHGSAPQIHTCSGPDSHNEQKTGIQCAITNGTPVPPPQVRTTPPDGGGLRSNRRSTDGSPSPAPAAATTMTSAPGGRTAAAMTSGWMLLP